MRIAALLVALIAGSAQAEPLSLDGLTDRMQAQAARDAGLATDMKGKIMVPTTSPYLGRAVADPSRLPFYTSRGSIQFSDGFVAHTVHHAVDKSGTSRLVVLAHGISRGDVTDWHVAADEPVTPAKGSKFVGSNAGKMECKVGNSEALAFGYLLPTEAGYEADGAATVIFELDPHSNLIPMAGFKAICSIPKGVSVGVAQ